MDPIKAITNDLRITLNNLQQKKDALKEAQLTMNIVLDAVSLGVMITDKNNEIKYYNTKFKWLFSGLFDLSDLRTSLDIFKALESHIAEGSKEVFAEIKRIAASTESSIDKMKVSLNSKKFYDLQSNVIWGDGQSFWGRIWVITDVTAESELDRQKSEFISLASHQLRTPVTSIVGYIDMLLSGDFGEIPPDIHEAIESVHKSAESLVNLVNDMLDLSRLETGKMKPQHQSIDIRKLVLEQVSLLEEISRERQVAIDLEIEDVSVNTDGKLLGEIIKNYLSNAIKYSHHGQKVAVKTVVDKESVLVEVIDSGIGIPVDQHSKLFNKFYRASNVLEQEIAGSGLGLYYAQKCADAIGAELGFHSAQGDGSVFWIKLPVEPAPLQSVTL